MELGKFAVSKVNYVDATDEYLENKGSVLHDLSVRAMPFYGASVSVCRIGLQCSRSVDVCAILTVPVRFNIISLHVY